MRNHSLDTIKVPQSVTLGRFNRLNPQMGHLVMQAMQKVNSPEWRAVRPVIHQIERAETPEAIVALLPQTPILASPLWLRRVSEFAPDIIPVLLAQFEHLDDFGAYELRDKLIEQLCNGLYVCGPEAAPPLLEVFPRLEDDYAKSHAALVLGMLGYEPAADTLWDFYHSVIDVPNEGFCVGPLWGLVDLEDPRAADALAEVWDRPYYFHSIFAMTFKAGDERVMMPLIILLPELDEDSKVSARYALGGIAHRIGKEAFMESLAAMFAGPVTPDQQELVAGRVMNYTIERGEEYFEQFFTGLDASTLCLDEVMATVKSWGTRHPLTASPAPTATPAPAPDPAQPGRNDPCHCGSGKKYKHCHWRKDRKG